jgi:hypothetical protein
MYELLSDITEVPVPSESLTQVHTGMNKVKISVGEHISEPSEVYIATGKGENGYETYIVFFMIEPAFHVIYCSDKNPYVSEGAEEVINEAIDFVEEMGSILEEVPWEGMSPEQRTAWIDKESLYEHTVTVDPEILEVVEEIESVEILEVVEEEEIEVEPEILDDAELELEDAEDPEADPVEDDTEDLTDDLTGDLVVEQVEELDEPRAVKDDVVVVDGDFDDLLKQAFLNPEVARKTRGKKRKAAVVEEPEEVLQETPEQTPDELSSEESSPEESPLDESPATEPASGSDIASNSESPGETDPDEVEIEISEEDVETEPAKGQPEFPTPASPVEKESSFRPPAEIVAEPAKAASGGVAEASISADEKTLLRVVRFLSRF